MTKKRVVRKFPDTVINKLDAETKFWLRVRSSKNGCWEWIGVPDRHGYGRLKEGGGRAKRVHRYSWEIHFGEIPDGLCVCHKCDNRKCIRPDHLFLGTNAENMADMDAKGRRRPGLTKYDVNKIGKKLNPDAVREIRCRLEGGMFQHDVAKAFGVAQATIQGIASGKYWSSVT